VSIKSAANPFKNGRFYHLPTHSESFGADSDWDLMSGGLRRTPINKNQFANSLDKARHGDYKAVVLPGNSALHPDFEHFVSESHRRDLQVIYQIPSPWLHRIWARHGDFFKTQPMAFEVILEDLPGDAAPLTQLQKEFPVHFTIPGVRGKPIWNKLRSIPYEYYEDLHFYFPYHGDKKKIFKPHQVTDLLSDVKKINPELSVRSPLGIDIFEPRIESLQDIEPLVQPVFRRTTEKPKISVVIPAFNNGSYLANTLSHLDKQDLDKSMYEVVVVDDGSSDNTSELILQATQELTMPMTVMYYPRMKKREMGDSQFRAGLARNLGVKWASGELLVFLDSDIIVPPHFLRKTAELHETSSIVLWRRDYLNKDVNSTAVTYEGVQPERDCFIPEGGYWHNFYQQAQKDSWQSLPDFWKYTCTYALSLPAKVFKEAGWFRKTYCFYGFEDTDLGLRLADAGYSFHFHNEAVYHLFHETGRSEFKNSFFFRQRLLKNTARIFYHNNLSPEIYRVFKYLLKGFF